MTKQAFGIVYYTKRARYTWTSCDMQDVHAMLAALKALNIDYYMLVDDYDLVMSQLVMSMI